MLFWRKNNMTKRTNKTWLPRNTKKPFVRTFIVLKIWRHEGEWWSCRETWSSIQCRAERCFGKYLSLPKVHILFVRKTWLWIRKQHHINMTSYHWLYAQSFPTFGKVMATNVPKCVSHFIVPLLLSIWLVSSIFINTNNATLNKQTKMLTIV